MPSPPSNDDDARLAVRIDVSDEAFGVVGTM
jgi:hypothetical protein